MFILLQGPNPLFALSQLAQFELDTSATMKVISLAVNEIMRDKRFSATHRLVDHDLRLMKNPLVCTDPTKRDVVSEFTIGNLQTAKKLAEARGDLANLPGIMRKIKTAEDHLGTCEYCRLNSVRYSLPVRAVLHPIARIMSEVLQTIQRSAGMS